MTAGELRKALEGVPDDRPVLRDGGFDHSYLPVTWGGEVTAGYFQKMRHWCEWYGEDHASEGEESRHVFLLSAQ